MYAPSSAEESMREVLIAFLIILILVGNTLVIAAYKTNHRLHTGFNLFIIGMAASDWLVGAVAVPLYLVILRRDEPIGDFSNRFYMSLDIFSGTASVFHLICVTVERYIAVSKPFFHHSLVLEVYYYFLGAIWIMSLLLSCLNFLLARSSNYPLWVLLSLFVLALVIIPSINIRVFKITKTLAHNSVAPVEQARSRRIIQRDRRVAVTLAAISGIFFVAWLPHVVGAALFSYCFPCNMDLVNMGRLATFIKWMQYSNSAINPFVFAFRDADVRTTIVTLLKRCNNAFSFRAAPENAT